jgi:hypothetical protein
MCLIFFEIGSKLLEHTWLYQSIYYQNSGIINMCCHLYILRDPAQYDRVVQ